MTKNHNNRLKAIVKQNLAQEIIGIKKCVGVQIEDKNLNLLMANICVCEANQLNAFIMMELSQPCFLMKNDCPGKKHSTKRNFILFTIGIFFFTVADQDLQKQSN